MKRNRFFIFTVMMSCLIVATIFFACDNLGIPESLTIKTDATYSLGLGVDALDISEFLSAKTLQNLFGENDNFKVYSYNPNGQEEIQHFLIEYAAVNTSLDLSDIFDNLDVGEEMGSALNFDRTFSVSQPADGEKEFPRTNMVSGTVPVEFTLEVDKTHEFEATVKSGKMILSLTRPSGWENVTATTSAEKPLTVSGGVGDGSGANQFADKTSDHPGYLLYQELDLAGKKFKSDDIILTGEINIETQQPVSGTMKLEFKVRIDELSDATIALDEITTSFDYDKPVPDSLKNFVKQIYYNGENTGIKFNYRNNLPSNDAGNNIKVKIESDFLRLPYDSSAEKELTPDGGPEIKFLSKNDGQPIDVENIDKIDIKVNLILPGQDMNEFGKTKITVKNIVPGTDYSIAVSDFDLMLDWTKIVVDSSKLSPEDSEIDFPLNIASMFDGIKSNMSGMDDLVSKLVLPDIPIYIYMMRPEIISTDAAKGAFILKGDDGKENVLLPKNSEIALASAPISLEKTGNNVTADFQALAQQKEITELSKTAFSTVLNDKWENTKIAYEFLFGRNGNLEITKAQVDEIKNRGGNLGINASVFIDIPLKMKVSDDVIINMMQLAGKQEMTDLLQRAEAIETEDFESYFNAIESIKMNLNMKNNIFFSESGNIKFVLDDTDIENEILGKKEISFPNIDIDFKREQIVDILETYPYMPKVQIELPIGSGFQLPQNSVLGFAGTVEIETNGEIEIPFGDVR